MVGYGINEHWLEDNTSKDSSEEKYHCTRCEKNTTWYLYHGSNGIDNWTEYECGDCGAGDKHLKGVV